MHVKMRYSIEPRNSIFVKGYRFLSFAKNMGKSLRDKYDQKLLDRAKKSTADAIKAVSKRAIQKTAEATGDFIGNKIADKITSVSKKPATELHSKKLPPNNSSNNNNNNNNNNEDVEITVDKKRYISPEERQKIIDELMLTLKRYISLKVM